MKVLTEEQQAIVQTDLRPGEVLKVAAFAGTGKTSTLVAYSQVRPETQMLYLAFNRTAAEAARQQFDKRHVHACTIHSLAFNRIPTQYRDNVSNYDISAFSVKLALHCNFYAAALVVKALKSWMNSADETLGMQHTAFTEEEARSEGMKEVVRRVIDGAARIWAKMLAQEKYFPMTHSGYLKLFQLGKPDLPFKVIMLDESQDTNAASYSIILRQVERGASLILVGDRYQSIYSWRGAINAMDVVKAPILPLTTSFRFGQGIAEVANRLLSTYFKETAPLKGLGAAGQVMTALPAEGPRTIVARTNVEIFKMAVTRAQNNSTFAVISGQFDKTLDDLADLDTLRKGGAASGIRNVFLAKFKDFEEVEEYAKAAEDGELVSKVSIVKIFNDGLLDAIRSVRAGCRPPAQTPLLLTTCHQAKGQEWTTVGVADDFSPLFTENNELRRPNVLLKGEQEALDPEEINLLYVAVTRAKSVLRINRELARLMCLPGRHPEPAVAPAVAPAAAAFKGQVHVPALRRLP